MAGPSWGHVSRHCDRCAKVGPRIQTATGWVHFYCLTTQEKITRRRAQQRAHPSTKP